jgi:hypothetical protein
VGPRIGPCGDVLCATALGVEIEEPGKRCREQLVHIFDNLTQIIDEQDDPKNMQVHRIRLADCMWTASMWVIAGWSIMRCSGG